MIVKLVAPPWGPPNGLLWCEAECKVNARKRCVAQVIYAVNFDDINVLRVKPVAWPRVNESERIATVLEAVIAVIGLADTKRVLLPKIGLEFVCGDSATTVTTGALRLLLRLSLLCGFLFWLGALLLLRRGFFLLLCGFRWLRLFLVLGRLGFLFFLLVVLLLLCVCRSSDSKSQRQNCCADHSY